MGTVSIYLPRKMEWKLLEESSKDDQNVSLVIQKALRKYWGGKDGKNAKTLSKPA